MITAAVGLVALVIGVIVGVIIGHIRGERNGNAKADRAHVEALKGCPACTRGEKAARRLAAVGARVRTVEWYGGDSGYGGNAVDDANYIVALAISRAARTSEVHHG